MIDRTPFSVGFAITLWSSCFVAFRISLTSFDPEPLALLRVTIAATCMVIFGIIKKIRLPQLRDIPTFFFHGLIGIVAFNLAILHGAERISVGSTSFIVSTVPVIATILAVVFLKERITRRNIFGIIISMIGVGIISFGEGDGLTLNVGALFVLMASCFDSVYNIFQKQMLKRYTSVEYVTYTFIAGALSLCVYMPDLIIQLGDASPSALMSTFYLGFLGTAAPYALWCYSISKSNISRIVVFQYAIPILATAIGYVVLGETSPSMALWGGVVALFGAMVSSLPSRFIPKHFAHQLLPFLDVSEGGYMKEKCVTPCTIRHDDHSAP